jgi:hypothetical protein
MQFSVWQIIGIILMALALLKMIVFSLKVIIKLWKSE